jgi:hypothetical protein
MKLHLKILLALLFSTFYLIGDNTIKEKKIALLIGNKDYKSRPLNNSIRDIELLAETLKRMGFTVIKKKNLTRTETIEALREFRKRVDRNTIALVYFSGHGINSKSENRNYLIPIGAYKNIFGENSLKDYAISDTQLLDSIDSAKFAIVLLDACRSNDLINKRGVGRKGLGVVSVSLKNDYIISYATEVGEVADDGIRGDNSPYAKALAKYLPSKDSIANTFINIRAEVSKFTNGRQKPYYEPHFENNIYLNKNNINGYVTIRRLKYQNGNFGRDTWENAKDYCRDLSSNGSNRRWRLPTKNELKLILSREPKKSSKGISYYVRKEFIENMPKKAFFWTSNTYRNEPSFAWFVDFNNGSSFWEQKDRKNYILCVQ